MNTHAQRVLTHRYAGPVRQIKPFTQQPALLKLFKLTERTDPPRTETPQTDIGDAT
jgi:hypothetical protein